MFSFLSNIFCVDLHYNTLVQSLGYNNNVNNFCCMFIYIYLFAKTNSVTESYLQYFIKLNTRFLKYLNCQLTVLIYDFKVDKNTKNMYK